MRNSRRAFLVTSAAALVGAAPPASRAQTGATPPATQPQPTPGSPPAFGTVAPVGPEVTPEVFAAAEKLVRIELTGRERGQAAQSWRSSMAPLYERRTGPRKVSLTPDTAPALLWNPAIPGTQPPPATARFVRSARSAGPLPSSERDVALAPVWKLSQWLKTRRLTSEQLTRIYLARIAGYDQRLRSVIT